MTIPAALSHIEYVSSGASDYVYPFQIDTPGELEVRIDGTVVTETVQYTVAGVASPTGGTITFLTIPPTGSDISIRRVVDIEQLLDLVPNAALPAVALEDQLDEIVKQIQMLEEVDSRTPSLPVGTPFDLRYLDFPPPGNGMTIGWNADGSALTLFPSNIQGITVNPVSGVGSGKITVVVTPSPGTAQASAVVFPPTVLGIAVTIWIETGFIGLEAIGIGTPDSPDKWGYLTQLTTDTETTAGLFQSYTAQPQLNAGTITLTAYGGLFNGTGTVYITGHFLTFDPSHTEGLAFTPGTSGASMPFIPATETEAGIVELATAAETVTGTDTTRATHPLGVKTAIDTAIAAIPPDPPDPSASETVAGRIELATTTETTTGTDDLRAVTPLKLQQKLTTAVTGTALTIPRYTAGGTALETTPGLITTSDGRLGVGVTPETGTFLQVQGPLVIRGAGFVSLTREGSNAAYFGTVYSNTQSQSAALTGSRTRGTEALSTGVTDTSVMLRIGGRGHDGTAIHTSLGAFIDITAAETWSSTARGTRVTITATLNGTTTAAERFRVDGTGNVGISNSAPKFPLHVTGTLAYGVPTAEPTTIDLSNGQIAWWLNEGDNTLRAVMKRSDGTIRRVSITTTA